MNFQSRHFVQSNRQRPTTIAEYDPASKALVVVTPWGPGSGSKTLVSQILSALNQPSQDSEATQIPNAVVDSPLCELLRRAVEISNQAIHMQFNSKEITEGYEVFVGIQKDFEFAWTTVGQPHVLISRNSLPIMPLKTEMDSATEFYTNENPLPALPAHLLGLNAKLNFSVQSFCPQPEDSLVLLSRQWIPPQLFNQGLNRGTLEGLVSEILKHDDSAFWMGLLKF